MEKRIRLATAKDLPPGCSEYLELASNGAIHWTAYDNSIASATGLDVGASFPVDILFAEEFFAKIGRKLDRAKLPANTIFWPYGEHSHEH